MTDYSRLATEPERFLALTGSMLEEFAALLPIFSDCFLAQMQAFTLAGTPRQKPYVSYQNCPLPTLADKLLFILMYLRKATTQDIFGAVFNMAQPVANQWIHRLHPCLNQALATLQTRPARTADALDLADDAVKRFFQDGTERPIQRPTEQAAQRALLQRQKEAPHRQEPRAGQCARRNRAAHRHLRGQKARQKGG